MVSIPIPYPSTSVDQLTGKTFVVQTVHNPLIEIVYDTTTRTYDMLRWGRRTWTMGPRVIRNGKHWSPCRNFSRAAVVMQPIKGKMAYPYQVSPPRAYRCFDGTTRSASGAYVSAVTLGSGIVRKPDNASTTIPLNTRNRLITECLQKAGRRSVNFGEAIGESRKTINHLASSVSDLVRALLAARRGRWREVAKILRISFRRVGSGKTLSERWLEYLYGWLPLINDIYDTAKLVKDGFASTKPMVLRSARVLTETSEIVNTQVTGVLTETKVESKFRCVLYYMPSSSWVNQANQIGLINPLEVVWALMPYSFVIDWLLPVGNFLEAVSARMSIDYIDGAVSHRREESGTCKFVPAGLLNEPNVGMFAASSYYREAISNPYPSLYVKSPFSSTHVITALALLRQLRR